MLLQARGQRRQHVDLLVQSGAPAHVSAVQVRFQAVELIVEVLSRGCLTRAQSSKTDGLNAITRCGIICNFQHHVIDTNKPSLNQQLNYIKN